MPENKGIDVNNVFSPAELKKLAGRRGEIERLAESEDGKRVRALLSGTDLESAARSGDIASITSAVRSALSTEEGARLAQQLRGLMK
ncbi:MAG: hypothetical protein LBH17_08355 [Oscillospiraceae bacterium]|jgi:hypothetical protein|nr:hypothetical protein [Oscillospiraceae bacterium]